MKCRPNGETQYVEGLISNSAQGLQNVPYGPDPLHDNHHRRDQGRSKTPSFAMGMADVTVERLRSISCVKKSFIYTGIKSGGRCLGVRRTEMLMTFAQGPEGSLFTTK